MKNDFIINTYNQISEFLNNNFDHQNKKIDYILYNNKNETYTLASDGIDTAIEFAPYDEGMFHYVPEWDYNFDYYIYSYLDDDFKIGYMSDEVHYALWNSINELWPKDIDYVDGVKYYIDYCSKNGINKNYLDKVIGSDTPDIMKMFKNDEMEI